VRYLHEKEDCTLEKPETNVEQQPQQELEPCGNCTTQYTVREGDSFYTIARQFAVSFDQLAQANAQLSDPTNLAPGQTINIPVAEPESKVQAQTQQTVTCPPGTFRYTVQPGDSMFLIAQRFGVSLNALIAANPQIQNPNLIFPGQVICVPSAQSTICPPGTFRYTVQPGDSMFLIAQRFGVSLNALIAANPQITNPSRIFPGQIVCVPTR
jgi:spore coat assembly protein SafA